VNVVPIGDEATGADSAPDEAGFTEFVRDTFPARFRGRGCGLPAHDRSHLTRSRLRHLKIAAQPDTACNAAHLSFSGLDPAVAADVAKAINK
jgi:hypothetical protein